MIREEQLLVINGRSVHRMVSTPSNLHGKELASQIHVDPVPSIQVAYGVVMS